jgi:NitT/TauT family transport system substrate-binding protein
MAPTRERPRATNNSERGNVTGLRFLALYCAVALVLPGAARAQAPKLEKSSIDLAVGGKVLVGYLPLTIAERRGLFAKAGLDVVIHDFAAGAKALEALMGGSADVVCGAYEHTILMAGIKLTAVALQNNSYGLVIALPPARAAAYRSPADLKGLKVGTTGAGSSSALGLRVLIAKAGLTEDDLSIIGVGAGAGAAAAMKSGRLDAMANFDPVMSILQRDGALVPVVDTRKQADLEYLYGGPFAGSAFYVRQEFAKRNPNTTQAFVSAIAAAIAWIDHASTDEIVAAVPEEYYGGDRELYRVVIERNRPMFSRDGRISLAAAATVLRAQASFDETIRGAKIDLAQTFDNSFLDRAIKAGTN